MLLARWGSELLVWLARLARGISVHEIMMYKNHLSRKYQKELVLFEDAGAMVVEEGKLETEVEPPHLREWRDQWWKERKRRNRL